MKAIEGRLVQVELTLKDQDVKTAARDARAAVVETNLQIHQAKCEQNGFEILRRFGVQDRILWAILSSLIGGLALVAWDLMKAKLGG